MEQPDPTLCACGCGRERPRFIQHHDAISVLDRLWMGIVCDLKTGCWLWQRGGGVNGYGLTTRGGVGQRMRAVHRVMWELINGPIPAGLTVLHDCDRFYSPGDVAYRRCCRPDHLKLGTNADNTAHMVNVGRMRMGPRTRLTETDVLAIRHRFAEGGISRIALGREYGVGYKQIGLIISRHCWPNLA
jgi:hypothetical protein